MCRSGLVLAVKAFSYVLTFVGLKGISVVSTWRQFFVLQ